MAISKYPNGKLALGVGKITINSSTFDLSDKIHLITGYTKRVSVSTLRQKLQVRTNNIQVDYNVNGQGLNTRVIYQTLQLITNKNIPASPSIAERIISVALSPTPFDVYGGGAGKTRIILIRNLSASPTPTITLQVDGDTIGMYLPPFPPSSVRMFILVDTPTTDKITLSSTASSGVALDVLETDTSNLNVDSYTITYEEIDSTGNIIFTHNDTGNFYWFFCIAGERGDITYGGGGSN
jgi:hypothetical protein